MKKLIIISAVTISMFSGSFIFAGNETTGPKKQLTSISPTTEVEKPFIITEEVAQFPGGNEKLENYFIQHINYPDIAKAQGIVGKVIVSFVIDENGDITNIELVQGIGGGCDEEVVRVLTEMPNWKPTNQAGHRIKSKKLFSFNFQL